MKIEVSNRLNNIGEYYFSTKLAEIESLKSQGKDIINLGIGSPDRPPHREVIDILNEESSKATTHAYQSYRGDIRLRKAFSDWYLNKYNVKVNPQNEILSLIGSKEGLMFICMTYLNCGDEVLIPNPGYPTYRSAVTISSGTCVEYELKESNDYQIDFEELEKKNLSKVKMLIANYPHMPTGAKAKKETLEKLVFFCKKHNILLVHDNPYSFVRNDNPTSILSIDGALDVAIELNSLSKSHNMAGWRIGAIFGKKERIDEIIRFKSNQDSGMFLPMQLAAAKALSLGDSWYKELNDEYYLREKAGYELMELLGCEVRKNQCGLFLWGRIPNQIKDCYQFIDNILYTCDVFITPGAIFGSEGNRYIRISLCATEDKIKEAIKRIKNNN